MPVSMAASFDITLMRQISEVVGVESRALSQRDYLTSYDKATGLHGVVRQLQRCFGPSLAYFLSHFPTNSLPTRAVCRALLGGHACGTLIGACNLI